MGQLLTTEGRSDSDQNLVQILKDLAGSLRASMSPPSKLNMMALTNNVSRDAANRAIRLPTALETLAKALEARTSLQRQDGQLLQMLSELEFSVALATLTVVYGGRGVPCLSQDVLKVFRDLVLQAMGVDQQAYLATFRHDKTKYDTLVDLLSLLTSQGLSAEASTELLKRLPNLPEADIAQQLASTGALDLGQGIPPAAAPPLPGLQGPFADHDTIHKLVEKAAGMNSPSSFTAAPVPPQAQHSKSGNNDQGGAAPPAFQEMQLEAVGGGQAPVAAPLRQSVPADPSEQGRGGVAPLRDSGNQPPLEQASQGQTLQQGSNQMAPLPGFLPPLRSGGHHSTVPPPPQHYASQPPQQSTGEPPQYASQPPQQCAGLPPRLEQDQGVLVQEAAQQMLDPHLQQDPASPQPRLQDLHPLAEFLRDSTPATRDPVERILARIFAEHPQLAPLLPALSQIGIVIPPAGTHVPDVGGSQATAAPAHVPFDALRALLQNAVHPSGSLQGGLQEGAPLMEQPAGEALWHGPSTLGNVPQAGPRASHQAAWMAEGSADQSPQAMAPFAAGAGTEGGSPHGTWEGGPPWGSQASPQFPTRSSGPPANSPQALARVREIFTNLSNAGEPSNAALQGATAVASAAAAVFSLGELQTGLLIGSHGMLGGGARGPASPASQTSPGPPVRAPSAVSARLGGSPPGPAPSAGAPFAVVPLSSPVPPPQLSAADLQRASWLVEPREALAQGGAAPSTVGLSEAEEEGTRTVQRQVDSPVAEVSSGSSRRHTRSEDQSRSSRKR